MARRAAHAGVARRVEQIAKLPPRRRFAAAGGPCTILGGAREVALSLDDYWPRLEQVAVQTLLAYLEADEQELDVDELYSALLPDGAPG